MEIPVPQFQKDVEWGVWRSLVKVILQETQDDSIIVRDLVPQRVEEGFIIESLVNTEDDSLWMGLMFIEATLQYKMVYYSWTLSYLKDIAPYMEHPKVKAFIENL